MKITRAGVDIAKSVFHVHAVDRHDQLRWQAKLKRGQWLDALSERLVPGGEVGMEACASAHHWSRELQQRGFRVKLIAAQNTRAPKNIRGRRVVLLHMEGIIGASAGEAMRSRHPHQPGR